MIRFLFLGMTLALAWPVSAALPERRTPVVVAVEKALPSVVNIGTERYVKNSYADRRKQFRSNHFDQLFNKLFGPPAPPGYQRRPSLGSGVIIHQDGYILTNFHVVERASIIHVTTHDGASYIAKMIAGDELNDLALLKVDVFDPLIPITLAADDDLLLGETVIAIGNPLRLNHTVTVGVLSAKNREAKFEGEVLFRDILQTDADINLGSSGGALLNIHGDLIGINVAILADESNIGFAVPVARARHLLSNWLSPKTTKRLWLGFEADEGEEGLVVRNVAEDTWASREGLAVGDRIVAINGVPISDLYHYHEALLPYREGDGILVEATRGELVQDFTIPLVPVQKPSGKTLAQAKLGLAFDGSRVGARVGKMNFMKGLKIDEVLAGGSAASSGLRPGILVTKINGHEVDSLDDVGIALQDVRLGDPVELVVVNIRESGPYMVAQRSSVQLEAN